jgi:branched-subunit amino acid permease
LEIEAIIGAVIGTISGALSTPFLVKSYPTTIKEINLSFQKNKIKIASIKRKESLINDTHKHNEEHN